MRGADQCHIWPFIVFSLGTGLVVNWPPRVASRVTCPPGRMQAVSPGPISREAFAATSLAGVFAIVGATVHAVVLGEHWSQSWPAGLAFTAVAGVQALWGYLAIAQPSRALIHVGLAGSALVISAWALAWWRSSPLIGEVLSTQPAHAADILTVGALGIVAGLLLSCTVGAGGRLSA
jgi:hypothetical protein